MIKSFFILADDVDNLSIKYSNIYTIDGRLTYLCTSEDFSPPYVNTFTNTCGWTPAIIKFENEELLNVYVQNLNCTREIELAVLGDNWWYGNIGHALFDGLYPMYVALTKFGYSQQPFTILSDNLDNKLTMSYDVMERFSGNSIIERYKMNHEVICFKTLVAGTGRTGNRVMNEEYTLYGKKYNALRQYKERLLNTYNVSVDKPLNDIPKIIIINNKRFIKQEHEVIKLVIDRLKTEADIRFIDWYHDIPSFADQMMFLQDIDIQVTGPGTAMMYTPFLKQGAVNVNLGYMEHTQTGGRSNIQIPGTNKDYAFPGWMEQSVCAGADYVSSIYYDRATYNNLEVDPLVKLIRQAINLVKSNIILDDNHNTDAKVFIEYCRSVPNAREVCNHLTSIAYFIELFVNEHPLAVPKPMVNINLLREIKDKYGYDRHYEIHLD